MDATIVDTLFDCVAAICVALLLYGGWLCLRYGRGMEPYCGNKKTFTTAARTAACAPVGADKSSGKGTMPAENGRASRAEERAEEVFNG